MGRAFVEEVFQGRETMGVRDVGIEEVTSTVAMMVLGGRGIGISLHLVIAVSFCSN